MKNKKRILVVDDEERFRRTLSQILESCDYDVTLAAGGAEALDLFQKKSFPLVITDMDMPGMSGIDLLKAVKRLGSECEVIILNSDAALDMAIVAMRAGAYDCLIKPLKDKEVICNTAHRAMEKVRLQIQNQNLIEALKQHNKALESANTRLKKMATHDGLTGLFNHRYFQDSLTVEINRARRYPRTFSMLFIDMDDFKIYNDTNGHLDGDRLLKQLSMLFMKSFRKTDIVARYGGDEFVVILPETNKIQAGQIADKLQQQVRDYPFEKCDAMPSQCLSVSIGVATYPEDGTTTNELLHHADQLLYEKKHKKSSRTKKRDSKDSGARGSAKSPGCRHDQAMRGDAGSPD